MKIKQGPITAFRLTETTKRRLKVYCAKSGEPLITIAERAIIQFLKGKSA